MTQSVEGRSLVFVSVRRILCAVVLLGAIDLGAQDAARRVTAVTAKGEVIEGILKSATETLVTLEVAGQQIQLPIAGLRYISFVGKLAAETAAKPALSPMEDAFAAVAELRTAAETGVLRSQWADKLRVAVPTAAPNR